MLGVQKSSSLGLECNIDEINSSICFSKLYGSPNFETEVMCVLILYVDELSVLYSKILLDCHNLIYSVFGVYCRG